MITPKKKKKVIKPVKPQQSQAPAKENFTNRQTQSIAPEPNKPETPTTIESTNTKPKDTEIVNSSEKPPTFIDKLKEQKQENLQYMEEKGINKKTETLPSTILMPMNPSSIVNTIAKTSTITAAKSLTGGAIETIKQVGHAGILNKAALNPKTIGITKNIISKVFSKKAMALGGAWAGAVYMGLWGNAESPEPLTYPVSKFLIPNAMETGDWSMVDEAQAQIDELTDLNTWEKLALASPASFAYGITKKIKGIAQGAEILKQVSADLRTQQETGETDTQKWDRINQRKAETEKASVDYYNEQRKLTFKFEQDAKKAATKERDKELISIRNADARYWAQQRKQERRRELQHQKDIAKFWLEYKKAALEIENNYTQGFTSSSSSGSSSSYEPQSKLDFGLL